MYVYMAYVYYYIADVVCMLLMHTRIDLLQLNNIC